MPLVVLGLFCKIASISCFLLDHSTFLLAMSCLDRPNLDATASIISVRSTFVKANSLFEDSSNRFSSDSERMDIRRDSSKLLVPNIVGSICYQGRLFL